MSEPIQGETTLAALTHVSGLVCSFLGPLLILLLTEDDELVRENAKSAINFQIVILILVLASLLLLFVPVLLGYMLHSPTILALGAVGVLHFPMVVVTDLALVATATVSANKGQAYAYPVTLNIV